MLDLKNAALFLVLVFPLLFSACRGCGASDFTIEVLNQNDIAVSQDLNIRVCLPETASLSELNVNVYLTERREWGSFAQARPYTEYFDHDFIGVPGAISRPIPTEMWEAAGEECFTAFLADVFKHTDDWIRQGICPFHGIVVTASYQLGAWNDAVAFECEVPAG